MYIAICLSNDAKTKGGFLSIEEADKYVENYCCKTCIDDLYDYDEKAIRLDYEETILDTPCGAEWIIIKEKDAEKCDNLGDIFEAAGYKKVNKKSE